MGSGSARLGLAPWLGVASSVALSAVLLLASVAYVAAFEGQAGALRAMSWAGVAAPALHIVGLSLLAAASYLLERRAGASGAFKYALAAAIVYVALNIGLTVVFGLAMYAAAPSLTSGETPEVVAAYVTGIIMSFLIMMVYRRIAAAAPPVAAARLRRAGKLYFEGAILSVVLFGFALALTGQAYAAVAFASMYRSR